ncbi:hypothetical protein, partial [Enterococcus sp.]|uniref:hypothetical protein n=1 Tax=Enterococcus sp. TaxID=35783 RepID=UPI002898DF25
AVPAFVSNYALIDSQHVSIERPVDKAPLIEYHASTVLSTFCLCFFLSFLEMIQQKIISILSSFFTHLLL